MYTDIDRKHEINVFKCLELDGALPEGHHLHPHVTEVPKGLLHLVVLLSQAQHDRGLGHHLWPHLAKISTAVSRAENASIMKLSHRNRAFA